MKTPFALWRFTTNIAMHKKRSAPPTQVIHEYINIVSASASERYDHMLFITVYKSDVTIWTILCGG